jgi:hypothetical protein
MDGTIRSSLESTTISGTTLTIACAGPVAMELTHLAPQIIARVNGHLGRQAVAQLKFSQGALLPRPLLHKTEKKAGPLPDGDPSRRYQGPEGLAKALQALARRR